MPNMTGGDSCGGLPSPERKLLEEGQKAAVHRPELHQNQDQQRTLFQVDPDDGCGHLRDSRRLAQADVSPGDIVAGLCLVQK